MSDAKITEPTPPEDPLLAALRELPPLAVDGSAEARLQRQARASYVRAFEGSPWHSSATSIVGRAAVPVLLAGVVGLYMTWAFAAAVALVH
jgi:hypothetical protein